MGETREYKISVRRKPMLLDVGNVVHYQRKKEDVKDEEQSADFSLRIRRVNLQKYFEKG